MFYTAVIDQCCDYLIPDQRTYHLRFLPSILQNDIFFSDWWRRIFRKCCYTRAVMTFHIHNANIHIANTNCLMFLLMEFTAGLAESINQRDSLADERLNWIAKLHCQKMRKLVEHTAAMLDISFLPQGKSVRRTKEATSAEIFESIIVICIRHEIDTNKTNAVS